MAPCTEDYISVLNSFGELLIDKKPKIPRTFACNQGVTYQGEINSSLEYHLLYSMNYFTQKADTFFAGIIPSPGDNSHTPLRKVRFVFPIFRITCGYRNLINTIAGQLSEHEKQDGSVPFVGRALINNKDFHRLRYSFLPSKFFLIARIKSAVSFRNEITVKLAITTTVDNVSITIQ